MEIAKSLLLRAEDLSISVAIPATKDYALELRELKRLELLTYELVPGRFSRDPATYKVSLTERARKALLLARK